MSATSDRAQPPPDRPPSGTVTFAFTDIEGSTKRWERDRAAMQEAVRRHDAVVRDAIVGHGGYVFKTVGDAFCAAFSRPDDAVAAMLDAQRALAAQDFGTVGGLRVRAAIHAGTADERDGDYFGPTVNRVARLLSVGHGGQILISRVTRSLIGGALPESVTLLDLGEHRLKDLTLPEHVYQLQARDLAADFPALNSLDARTNNLPHVPTSFVGRETELAEIISLVGKHRLVTLVGSGGIGKTRLSLQVAADLLDGYKDGVWLIELAALSSGEYVISTVAQALGLNLAAEGDPIAALVDALKSKQMLLIFDNCEHIVQPVASTISALLRGCPKLKVLASSRQPLGIGGEATYRIPSLALPDQVELFVERARAGEQHFTLTTDNERDVTDICRRLDGIPLAIELAAARVKMLSPKQLRERLDERFRVLTGGSRDALPRQQTLRALIDWSHDLLEERERALFRRLGIFVDGFTLEGAVAIGTQPDLDELDVFDVLSSLVDKSLVIAEPGGEERRHRLLESTRVYAREKLESAGERETYAGRHLQYFRDRFVAAQKTLERTTRLAVVEEALATELEDVRFALDWALGSAHAPSGAEILAAVDRGWVSLGLEREGLARLEAFASALGGDAAHLVARLWAAITGLALNAGRTTRASEAATEAVKHARASDDPGTLAEALGTFALSAARSGRFEEGEAALSEAESLPVDSPALRLRLLEAKAHLGQFRGDLDAAARAQDELRKEHRALGNVLPALTATLNLAEVEHARGQTRRAIELVREVLPELRASSDRSLLANILANATGYLASIGDLDEALASGREAIGELAGSDPDNVYVAMAIEHLALALALSGDLPRAALLAAYSDACMKRHGFVREFTETATRERLMGILTSQLPVGELSRCLDEGAALSPHAAVGIGLAR